MKHAKFVSLSGWLRCSFNTLCHPRKQVLAKRAGNARLESMVKTRMHLLPAVRHLMVENLGFVTAEPDRGP